MTSKFLVPQKPCEDPKASITLHPIYIVQHAKFSEIASRPIGQHLFDTTIEKLRLTNIVANQDILGAENESELDDIYRWYQNDDTIKIVWPKKSEIYPDAQIVITEDKIESPYVCGNWYDKVVGEPVINDDGKNVEIEIKVTSKWPILIKGDESIDRMSLFYLAAAAMKTELSDEFECFLTHAGMEGSVLAASTIGYFYSQTGRNNEALYWFTRFADLSNQDLVLLIVARILMDYGDGALGENILIMIAKQGERDFLRAWTNAFNMHFRFDLILNINLVLASCLESIQGPVSVKEMNDNEWRAPKSHQFGFAAQIL